MNTDWDNQLNKVTSTWKKADLYNSISGNFSKHLEHVLLIASSSIRKTFKIGTHLNTHIKQSNI
jgi:hypothetical protein